MLRIAHLRLSAFIVVLILCRCYSLPVSNAAELSAELRQRCLDVLQEGIQSEEFWPSIHAAEALTLAGQGHEVRALLEPRLAAERDDQKRCGLSRELYRAGDRLQADVLLDILAGEDSHGHVHAAESLYKIWEVGDGVALRRAVAQTTNAKLRLMAAGALVHGGNLAALTVIRESISDDDAELRQISAWLLARVGDKSDIPAIRASLKRAENDFSRGYFHAALANLGDEQGLKFLADNLQHEDPAVRVYAATFAGDARAASLALKLTQLLDDAEIDVRIRSAQSLLALHRPASKDAFEEIVHDVFPANDDHPRYSEGSILSLRDGSLLYATTEFIQGGSDFSAAQIIARESKDEGRTWSPKRVLQQNVGAQNVMSATLRRLPAPDGTNSSIALFYLVKNGYSDLKAHMRISRDESQSFQPPILVTNTPGYHVVNNDRVTILDSGRLLVPAASTADVRKTNHFVAHCFLSDDLGKTWRDGLGSVDLAKRGAMEPEVFQTNDGRVGMILRTQLGYIAVSYSSDGGDNWSNPQSLGVIAGEAPATLRRIPATGDLLLIWNNHFQPGANHGGKRTPLTAAISSDEGKTWSKVRNLEQRHDQSYAYTSLTFVQHRAVMSYYVEEQGRISSRFRSIPIRAFYAAEKFE